MSVIETTRRPLKLGGADKQHAPKGSAATVALEMETQCHSNWCWAAVAVSVAAHYGSGGVRQCDIANLELKRKDCCRHPCNAKHVDFNVASMLASPLNRLRCLDRLARNERAKPAEVRAELAAGRPLCVRTVWRDGGAHFVAIVGYRPDTTDDGVLVVDDPFWGPGEYSYARFAEHYQLLGGRWTDTYYTRAPAAHTAQARPVLHQGP